VQSQSIGDGGVGVQVDGDKNTVTIHARGARLTLDQRHRLRAEPRDERELLLTDLRVTDLVGREGDLATLVAWLSSDRPIAARCLTGRAGAGKTRLALELCERAEAMGWIAGFARHDELQRFYDGQNLTGWRWSRPTLVVIDYAAASSLILRAWLEALALCSQQEPRLRLLLLERHADREFGWWPELIRPESLSRRGPEALVDPPEPVALASLRSAEDRRALLSQAIQIAARLRGVAPAPQPPLAGANAEFDRRLADDAINNEPLYLVMAGLVAVTTGAPAALALSRTDLAERVADAEAGRLKRLAASWGIDAKLVLHIAACATLEGGSEAKAADRLVAEERQALGYPAAIPAEHIAVKLAEALPASTDGIDAIRPDLIGEAFVLRQITRDRRTAAKQAAIVERAWRRSGTRVIATVIRAAQDYATGRDHPSLRWVDHLADLVDDPFALITIAKELPEQTLALRERALEIIDRIARGLAARVDAQPELRTHLAIALNKLAKALGEVGRREDALATARDAVAIRRELANEQPDAFRADLAVALANLGKALLDVGRREDALAVAQESVAIRRELAAQRPDAFRPELAGALNNLGVALVAVGRREDALAAVRESVAIHRELAPQRPDVLQPDLAMALGNLGNVLSDIGRHEEALAAAEQIADLFRELAAQRPDAFRPDLAQSLGNLGNRLSDVGRREDALAVARQAAELYRDLASQRPDAFRPDLARSLNNLGNRLSDVGRHEDALPAGREAVDLYRELATQRPDAFRPDLALALNNFAIRLSKVGRREDAIAAAQESVAIRVELAARLPDAFRPDLAGTLSNLGIWLSGDVGRLEDALAATQQATAIFRELAAEHPDAFRPGLATALSALGSRLSAVGQHENALAAARDAVAIRRQLATQRPGAFRPDLAMALGNLGVMLNAVGRRGDALAATQEAAAILRELAALRPDIFRPDLALALTNLGAMLSGIDRLDDALGAAQEAVDIYHKLAAQRPDAVRPNLAIAVNNLQSMLTAAGRREDALAAAKETEPRVGVLDSSSTNSCGHNRGGLRMMIAELALAAEAAVALISPFLAKVGEGAAKKVGEESAGSAFKVLGWMRDKLTGRAQEALNDLERNPESTDNQADLRKQLTKLLEAEPGLLDELRTLLPKEAPSGYSMTQTLGAGAKGAQIKGSRNTTSID
jgi:tetratricopeptide (TPR) repeat protein